MRRRQRLGRVSGSPARPPVAVRPSRGICSSYKKSPAGRNSSKNVPRLLQAHGGCLLDANACIKMKDSRGAAIQGSERANCIAELHCWASKLLKMNFGEISTKKKFRETFKKYFSKKLKSHPHLATERSGDWLKEWDDRRAQVKTSYRKTVREVAQPGPRRPEPTFRRNWGDYCRFLRKSQNIFQKFLSFSHTFRTRKDFLSPKAAAPSERACGLKPGR